MMWLSLKKIETLGFCIAFLFQWYDKILHSLEPQLCPEQKPHFGTLVSTPGKCCQNSLLAFQSCTHYLKSSWPNSHQSLGNLQSFKLFLLVCIGSSGNANCITLVLICFHRMCQSKLSQPQKPSTSQRTQLTCHSNGERHQRRILFLYTDYSEMVLWHKTQPSVSLWFVFVVVPRFWLLIFIHA